MLLGRPNTYILIPVVLITDLQVWGKSLASPWQTSASSSAQWVGFPATLSGPFQLQAPFLSVVSLVTLLYGVGCVGVCILHPRACGAAALLHVGAPETLHTVPLPPSVGRTLSPTCSRLGAQGWGQAVAAALSIVPFQPFIHPSPEISLGWENLLHMQRNAHKATFWVFS